MTPRNLRGTDQPRRGPHQVRAQFDAETITVYQAFPPEIAVPAAARGTFEGTQFKLTRMTWIKPSFTWMMYRSGWATKPGQEHVLAVTMTRAGFECALSLACLASFSPEVYEDQRMWAERMRVSPVRVQWDPERDLSLKPLPLRAIQIGLKGVATALYVSEWVTGIADITSFVHKLNSTGGAYLEVPRERPYPLSPHLARVIGATP